MITPLFSDTIIECIATIYEFSKNVKLNKKTILLKDLTHNDKLITEKCWITVTKEFDNIELKVGDLIRFKAKLKKIEHFNIVEYNLTHIKSVKKIGMDFSINNNKDIFWQAKRIKQIARDKYYQSLEQDLKFTKEDYEKEIARANDLIKKYQNSLDERLKQPTYVFNKK